jgi:Haem-binding uptake, Tiki superfamily, ChaN
MIPARVVAAAVAFAVAVGAASCSTSPTTDDAADEPAACTEPDPGLEPAVHSLLGLFDSTRVVAFGEHHGSPAEHRVLKALVCDPRFVDTVDTVVVEFGNQRLQETLDRYVVGEDVTDAELAEVWRESTQRSGGWDAPVYRELYAAVRAVNQGRDAGEQVQVLAGDPPIDWSTITSTSNCSSSDDTCLDYWLQRREPTFAGIVVDQVLDHDRTALLIAGAGHMTRRPANDGPPPSIPQLIEAEHPGTVTVVLPHDRFLGDDPAALDVLATSPAPALLPLDDGPLGSASACLLDDEGSCSEHTLANLADAYLYLGGVTAPSTPPAEALDLDALIGTIVY